MKRIIVLFSILLLLVPFAAWAQEPCEGNFDCDTDQDGTDASKFKSDFGRSGLNNPCPVSDPCYLCSEINPVPKTGQTTCYDTYGNPRNCASMGEDGEFQKGVASPNPRFKDNLDGTVTDNFTGLMWTKDAQQIPGTMTWQAALDACNNLVYSNYDDWRLPNIQELLSLIDYSKCNPALPQGNPFINVQHDVNWNCEYWSSTTCISSNYMNTIAWGMYFYSGQTNGPTKTGTMYVWPVRGGQ